MKNGTQSVKKRLCVDYSQTINLYTELDAYPLPRIDTMINKLAQYKVFSTYDLKNAYHQIPISQAERKYTAFEAGGQLYQFCRIPFGVTNGVAVFQRLLDKIIKEEELKDTFPYLDDITVAGRTQEEHDSNVKAFLEVVQRRHLTLNHSKSVLSALSITVLGYLVEHGSIKPDPDRLHRLQNLPPPTSVRSLRRAMGMFAFYAKWIPDFSDKITALTNANVFPLRPTPLAAFNTLKKSLERASLNPIDESLPFVVECDASEVAVSATLNQDGRPVAFMSRTLQNSELHYPPVEKEATAIIEAVRKWSHFLDRRQFTLITDQRSVAFMLDSRKRTKIENNKIQGWRLELASFSYTITYRPGKNNVGPDTLTRAFCASATSSPNKLSEIHVQLCHPGVTRLLHFVRTKNLPYSTDDVKRLCASCKVCSELKPQFYRAETGTLIKDTQPMERLSIDFKGPLKSTSRNTNILTVIDEYSRFPFPCPNTLSSTVIKCLDQLFTLCGTPSYIHSDRGTSFLSHEIKHYRTQKGIATSKTTPYHPIRNGQCERYNGIIWKGVQLALKSHNLQISNWEMVLSSVLHSIRSLLSTATNTTPHERFFAFQRRSMCGMSLPSWLTTSGNVMLRRYVRHTKNDPLVDEVELTDVNPTYAHIRYPDGRESTVSLKDLSPCPSSPDLLTPVSPVCDTDNFQQQPIENVNEPRTNSDHSCAPDETLNVRRSGRVRKVPDCYGY